MRVSFKTLGCKVNQAETQEIIRALASEGVTVSDDDPDIVVVNTCTVTGEADRKSRKTIRHLIAQYGEGTKVIVTGCYARLATDDLASIPGVHLVDTQRDKDTLIKTLIEMHEQVTHRIGHSEAKPAGGGRSRGTQSRTVAGFLTAFGMTEHARTRPFIKIQDGCDNHCTYCIVPAARGGSRSKPAAQVISEIEKAMTFNNNIPRPRNDIIEIVLTGVNLGKYNDNGINLTELLNQIMTIPKLGRVRISSIEPEDINDGLIELIAERYGDRPYVCRHLHIPLQSGDDGILKAMGRRYTSAEYKALAVKIKDSIPGVAITTDVIVGFPGESDEQFDNTCGLVQELDLSRLHVFAYSPRPGTPASALSGRLPKNELNCRSTILRGIGKDLEQSFRESQTGLDLDLVIETDSRGAQTGLSDNYVRLSL